MGDDLAVQPSGHEQARVMRVFVSSTFRDMADERDELVKRVFPQLAVLCRERDVVGVKGIVTDIP